MTGSSRDSDAAHLQTCLSRAASVRALSPAGSREAKPPSHCLWAKLGALFLVLAALGLPINDLVNYALLVIATVIVCFGSISRRRLAWYAAVLAVVVCAIGQTFLRAP